MEAKQTGGKVAGEGAVMVGEAGEEELTPLPLGIVGGAHRSSIAFLNVIIVVQSGFHWRGITEEDPMEINTLITTTPPFRIMIDGI
jgi:hypothetical protein